jgi:hypothetical protein
MELAWVSHGLPQGEDVEERGGAWMEKQRIVCRTRPWMAL